MYVTNFTLRRPDVAVYCPPFDDTAATSDRPRLVAEVLSPSTETIDHTIKFEEYQAIPSLQTLLLVNPRVVEVGLWVRGAGGWGHQHLRSIEDTAAVSDFGLTIALADIYDGMDAQPAQGPRLVWPDGGASPSR